MWASWADFGGRKFLYLISLVIFIASCTLLAALPGHIAVLFTLRVVQAFGASSVQSLGAGTVADTTEPKNRGSAIAFFMLGPQLGPILGPVLGGVIASSGSWRWIFAFLAFLGAIVFLLILFMLPETLRCLVGNGSLYGEHTWFVKPHLRQKRLVAPGDARFPSPPKPSLKGYLQLMSYPPVSLVSINAGLLFATYYGIVVTLSQKLTHAYGFTTLESGAAFLVPGSSLVLGSLTSGRLSDKLRRKYKERHPDAHVIPENRLPIQIFGVILSMMGVLGYGWMVHFHLHVAGVLAFTFLAGFGMTWVFVTNTTYLTECSPGMPASLVAIASFFRNMGATISSVVIEPLVTKMTFGWCFTGLALVDLFSVGMVIILMLKGPEWRKKLDEAKSAKAAKGPQVKDATSSAQPSLANNEKAQEVDGVKSKEVNVSVRSSAEGSAEDSPNHPSTSSSDTNNLHPVMAQSPNIPNNKRSRFSSKSLKAQLHRN